MASRDPRSWPDTAVGTCLTLLMAAAAIFIAVKLIEAVFTSLLVILGVGLVVTAAIALLRARNRSW